MMIGDVYCRSDDQMRSVTMLPMTSLPAVFELSYYANSILPIFADESVIGKKTAPPYMH